MALLVCGCLPSLGPAARHDLDDVGEIASGTAAPVTVGVLGRTNVMTLSPGSEATTTLVVRTPLAGVKVVRFAGERPLLRAIPEHYGTTLHLSGRSHWRSGREEWSSGPGSLSVKVPGEVSVERARAGELRFQTVLFDAALVDDARAVLERPLVGPRTHAMDPCDGRAQSLGVLHRRLLDEDALHVLEEGLCEALHAVVDLVCAPRSAAPMRRSQFSGAVTRARALLDERLTETVSLEELAAHARLDKFRLCRAFREQVGLPPHAYVTHRRVARAQDLLVRGMPQAEVAVRVGFYDQSLLHRHFKRILGLTPGAFTRASIGKDAAPY